MIKTMPISKARVNLGSLVNNLRKKGGSVVLEKNNIPVAVMINIDDWEDYQELNDPLLQRKIDKSYQEYKAGSFISASQVIQKMRAKYDI